MAESGKGPLRTGPARVFFRPGRPESGGLASGSPAFGHLDPDSTILSGMPQVFRGSRESRLAGDRLRAWAGG